MIDLKMIFAVTLQCLVCMQLYRNLFIVKGFLISIKRFTLEKVQISRIVFKSGSICTDLYFMNKNEISIFVVNESLFWWVHMNVQCQVLNYMPQKYIKLNIPKSPVEYHPGKRTALWIVNFMSFHHKMCLYPTDIFGNLLYPLHIYLLLWKQFNSPCILLSSFSCWIKRIQNILDKIFWKQDCKIRPKYSNAPKWLNFSRYFYPPKKTCFSCNGK